MDAAAANLPEKPKRRPRYRGTHPRHFAEKYKEHAPSLYPATVQKVLASGKTPAGMHRPICVAEMLQALDPQPGQTGVDATLGYGGHAAEILPRLQPGGRLLGLDVDATELPKTEARLRATGLPAESFAAFHSNFAGLAKILATHQPGGVDFVLADLGCSSMQIDNPARGFTFKSSGPLDMRLNPQRGEPASAWLAKVSETKLATVLDENADEPHAAEIARALCRLRTQRPIDTTTALASAVRAALAALPRQFTGSQQAETIRRVFQAVRIAVNDEFSALETLLRFLPQCLKPGGCAALLTFHSGEDRRVKKSFQEGLRGGIYAQISHEVVRPGLEEIRANPRAASAKLRWARRSE